MLTSLTKATSGMSAAQAGLAVTGHNMSNAGVAGYTRQRALQTDNPYQRVETGGYGTSKIGLGVRVIEINQIRSEFLDKSYRKEASKGAFYGVKMTAVEEIEAILGELYSDGRLSEIMENLWQSLHELQTHPNGIETRATFISNASKFASKVNQVADDLFGYQMNLNEQIAGAVTRINEVTSRIEELNLLVQRHEASGENANDYRDERNLLLDELSSYGAISITETATGRVNVFFEGKDLILNGSVSQISLRYVSAGYPFVEPVISNAKPSGSGILPLDAEARKLFSDLDSAKVNISDNGSLKALLMTRGKAPSTHMDDAKSVANYTIPKLQHELDILVNKVVSLFNDVFSPIDPLTGKLDLDKAPYDLNGVQSGAELFSRNSVSRFDPLTGEYIAENKNDRKTIYTMGNLKINPEVLNNYNKIPLSQSLTDVSDTSVIEKLLTEWKNTGGDYSPSFGNGISYNFDSYYKEVITNLGGEGQQAKIFVEAQERMLIKIDADRSSLSGVSMDEEISGMMRYQHAYNASARLMSVIDGMIESVIGIKR